MKRRTLLGVLAIVLAGGAALWTSWGGGGRIDGRARESLDDDAEERPRTVGDAMPAPITVPEGAALAGRRAPAVAGDGGVTAQVVRASDGAALAGIFVRFEGVADSGEVVARRVWSDDRGAVRFEVVPSGPAYALHVQRDPSPPVDRTGIEVRAGETTDVGRLELEAVGAVDALVLDARREPIAGATVSVSCVLDAVRETDAPIWPLEPALPGAFVEGVTDDRGRIRLEGVAPGAVAVRATSPGYRGRTFRAFVPAEPPKTAFAPFVLEVGVAYGGRVVDAERRPVAGALVEYGLDGATAFETKAKTRTNDDGTFALGGFSGPLAFDVRVSADGYSTAIASTVESEPADRGRSRRRVLGPALLEIVLDRGATFTVLVLDGRTKSPVSGARVRSVVLPTPASAGGPVLRTTYEGTSDEGGHAELSIPAGRAVDVEVLADEYRTFATSRLRGSVDAIGGTLVGDLSAPVTPGERRALTALLETGYALRGLVHVEGRPAVPIDGAQVELAQGGATVGRWQTDAKGRFEAAGVFLPDRAPRLRVAARGYYPSESRASPAPDAGGVVRIDVGLAAIERPISVVGTAVDGAKAPVAGALVRIPDRGLYTVTGADGAFRFEDLPRRIDPLVAAIEPVSVVVTKGALRAEKSGAVPKPDVGDVVNFGAVTPNPVAELTGIVLLGKSGDRARYPLVERLGRRSEDDKEPRVLETLVGGEFGDFRFLDLVAGTYRVRASDATRGGGRYVLVRDGTTDPTLPEVRIVEATVCAGRVEDARGAPIAGLTVRLECFDAPENGGDRSLSETTTVTDLAGAFRFRCFGARPERLHGPTAGRLAEIRREREWSAPVEAGDRNVVRLSRKEYGTE